MSFLDRPLESRSLTFRHYNKNVDYKYGFEEPDRAEVTLTVVKEVTLTLVENEPQVSFIFIFWTNILQ
jgi:hypothetical protein